MVISEELLPLATAYIGWKYDLGSIIKSWDGFIDLAEQFYTINPFFYDKNKIWWIWNRDTCSWIMIDETDIMNVMDKALASPFRTTSSQIKNEILESLKRVGRKHIPENIRKTWVQFGMKIIDIANGNEIMPHPLIFVTNPIPWDIGNSEDTPNMDKLFSEWVGEKYVETLYQIIAYCLLPSYPIHRIFCLNGVGCNGKGRFMALIEKFIGKDNVVSSDIDSLVINRFETAVLYRKLLCLVPETSFGILKNTGKLKQITGEDKIRFEFKNKNPFSDFNYAKLLMATNNLPATTDKSVGFYRRWFLIDFPNMFPEGKDVLEIVPDIEFQNLARKSIRILKELLEIGSFANEGTWQDREKKYEDTSNPVNMFIEEKCEKDIEDFIKYSEFRRELLLWLDKNKKRNLSVKDIRLLLGLNGYYVARKTIRTNPEEVETHHFVFGLRWKDEIKEDKQATLDEM